MKIFEFHFNPQTKPDLIFDSFCYEPQSVQEKKLGSLYIVGELKNALPQNSRLVNNLALLLKREYYLGSAPEASLKKALKKANDFLSERTKLGNVSWLGNLSLAAFSLRDLDLAFSKDGSIKILLLRPGQVTDIAKSFELEEFEPYPLKIFTNIVSGRFLENDKILILTKEVFDFFTASKFLEELAQASQEKTIKSVFRDREKEFSSLRGVCFLLFLTKETSAKSELTFRKIASPLSIKEILSPILKALPKINFKKSFGLPRFHKPELSLPKNISLGLLPLPRLNFNADGLKEKLAFILSKTNLFISSGTNLFISRMTSFHFSLPRPRISFDWEDRGTRQNLFLILLLASALVFGFLVSQREEETKNLSLRDSLLTVQEKVVRAQGYLSLGQDERARFLFQEAFNAVLPLSQNPGSLEKESLALKSLIEKNLLALNKSEEISDPEVVFDFAKAGFTPQHLSFFENSLYFFSPYERDLARLDENRNLEKVSIGSGINLGANDGNDLFLFSRPDNLFLFRQGRVQDSFTIKLTDEEAFFVGISAFKGNLYFLEKGTGKVVKYQQPVLENKEQPNLWIQPQEKKALDSRSVLVAGSVYVLADDNSIWEYRGGILSKVIALSVFPAPKRLMKMVVSPSLSLLALLEPDQGRIILVDRQGVLVKQLLSKKFLSLKDAAFSGDGKLLNVLSGSVVYQIKIQ